MAVTSTQWRHFLILYITVVSIRSLKILANTQCRPFGMPNVSFLPIHSIIRKCTSASRKSQCFKAASRGIGGIGQLGNDILEPKDSINVLRGSVTFLQENEHFVVVRKPPSVVCHHSGWTGSRAAGEVPMLKRVREATGKRLNLIHRLDRGCSGCLLLAYSDNPKATSALIESMANADSTKTYVALVRGEGILKGRDFTKEGWFKVDRPIKNENGVLSDATTWFRFIAGQSSGLDDQPRASLVLARPETGRWHQIRRHLNGLSHPILGDTTHGDGKVNREWRERGMLSERTCLHQAKLDLLPTEFSPNGISAFCPIAPDMMHLLTTYLPNVLAEAEPILHEEGIVLEDMTDPWMIRPIEIFIN